MGRDFLNWRWLCVCLVLCSPMFGAVIKTSGPCELRIPAAGDGKAWMEPSELHVEEYCYIRDLNVKVNITHSEVSDLRIILESPWGVSLMLKNVWPAPWREKYANLTDTVFDDDGADNLIAGEAPYTGVFRPEPGYPLSAFKYHNAQGIWRLKILDAYYHDTGVLNSWELQINHAPEPGALLCIMLGLPYLRAVRRSTES